MCIRDSYTAGERFVFVGRLSEEKGLLTFVKAVAEAGVSATIVGTGPQEAELQALVESTGADVTFAGYQTGEPLFDIVRNAKALVLPSECYENAPVVLLEAYGVGTPVLGSNLGGIPELIQPGITGELATAGDVSSFAEQLSAMNSLPESELSEMGRACLLYTSPSPRDATLSRMPSSA